MALGSGLQLLGSECRDGCWTVLALGQGSARCPVCDVNSTRRHGWQLRRLQDLLAQGTPGTLRVRPARWRCQNQGCEWQTSAIGFPIARPSARRTCRVADLTRLFGQAAGGRPAERLMGSLGRTVGNGSDAGLFIHRCSRSTQRRGNTSGWSMRRCGDEPRARPKTTAAFRLSRRSPTLAARRRPGESRAGRGRWLPPWTTARATFTRNGRACRTPARSF